MLAASEVSVSVGGIVIGLLLGALVYFVSVWLAGEAGQPALRVIGAILAIIVFVVLGFDFHGDLD